METANRATARAKREAIKSYLERHGERNLLGDFVAQCPSCGSYLLGSLLRAVDTPDGLLVCCHRCAYRLKD